MEKKLKTILETYKDTSIYVLRRFFKKEIEKEEVKLEELNQYLKENILGNYKPFRLPIKFTNESIDFMNLNKIINDQNLIRNSSGTFFLQHDVSQNTLVEVCIYFQEARKYWKNEMFVAMNNGDKKRQDYCNAMQKNYKILNNSFFGAAGAGNLNSFLFHPVIPSSITHCGQDLVTVALTTLERFLAANIYFFSFEEVYNYLYRVEIMIDQYEVEDYISIEKNVSHNELVDFILSKCDFKISEEEKQLFIYYINTFNQAEINKIYFKNNLYEFFLRTNFLEKFVRQIVGKEFKDANKPSEEIKLSLEDMWKVIDNCVFMNIQFYNRMKTAREKTRKVTLTIDTDSNFASLDSFYEFMKAYFQEEFPEFFDDSNLNTLSTINILSYNISKLLADTFDMFLSELNVTSEKHKKFINMKNEFTFSRVFLTKNKKHYAGLITSQEGNVFDEPKLEVKGISIKKSSTNEKVREFFMDVLENLILKAKIISRPKIFRKVKEFENTIKKSLLEGEMTYSVPGKANAAFYYKEDPMKTMSYRGCYVWNTLFPEAEISLPSKVNMFKLSMGKDLDFIKKNLLKYLTEEEANMYIERIKIILEKTASVKNGEIDIISVPKNLTEIPRWISQFVDVKSIVKDNVKHGLILLESLDFKTLTVNNDDYPTNIIEL